MKEKQKIEEKKDFYDPFNIYIDNKNARRLIMTTIIIIVYRVFFETKISYEFELGLRAYFVTFDLFSSFDDEKVRVL